MNHIRGYRPDFIDYDDKREATFNDMNELINIPWVRNFMNDLDLPFYRFSKNNHDDQEDALMAEYKSDTNHAWWVVGFMSKGVDLPFIDYNLFT